MRDVVGVSVVLTQLPEDRETDRWRGRYVLRSEAVWVEGTREEVTQQVVHAYREWLLEPDRVVEVLAQEVPYWHYFQRA